MELPMELQRLGNYERYVVRNDDGWYWAGICWTSSLREARVFAEAEAARKVIRILGQQLKDVQEGHKTVAEIVVTTSSWIPLQELRETLQRYVSIFNELQDDVLILDVEVDWDTLREREDD